MPELVSQDLAPATLGAVYNQATGQNESVANPVELEANILLGVFRENGTFDTMSTQGKDSPQQVEHVGAVDLQQGHQESPRGFHIPRPLRPEDAVLPQPCFEGAE